MPTLVLVDTSLSLARKAVGSGAEWSYADLLKHGLHQWLSIMETHQPLEEIGLLSFHSTATRLSSLTTNHEELRQSLWVFSLLTPALDTDTLPAAPRFAQGTEPTCAMP